MMNPWKVACALAMMASASHAAHAQDFSVSGTITVEDFREWCDPAFASEEEYVSTRYTCDAYAQAPLPYANILVRDALTDYHIMTVRTDETGYFSSSMAVATIGYLPSAVNFVINWTGSPTDDFSSFQILYDETVTSAGDLEYSAYRTEAMMPAGSCTTSGYACSLGTSNLTFPSNAPTSGNFCQTNDNCIWSRTAALYLTAVNFFLDDLLYVERYHDYCRINTSHLSFPKSCPEDWLIISGGAAGDNADRSVGTIMAGRSGQRAYGEALNYSLGLFLQGAASGLWHQSGSGDSTSTTVPWANFVSTAIRYLPSDEPFREVNGSVYSTEDGYAVCDDNTTPDDGSCDTDYATLNQTRAFWDLYDTNNEGSIYDCDSGKSDRLSLDFEEMLDGWAEYTNYSDLTVERGLQDAYSVANAWDYSENLYNARYKGVSAPTWQKLLHSVKITDTFLYHNCMFDQLYTSL